MAFCLRFAQNWAIVLLCSMAIGDGRTSCRSAEQAGTLRRDGQKQSKAEAEVNREGSETIRLQVRVTDSAGRPVPKAMVRIIDLTDEKDFQTETVAFGGTT